MLEWSDSYSLISAAVVVVAVPVAVVVAAAAAAVAVVEDAGRMGCVDAGVVGRG